MSNLTSTLHIHTYQHAQDYQKIFQYMQTFTAQHDEHTPDQLLILQHHNVLTQGIAGKAEHILQPIHDLPIVQTDRGGQVTWHGYGQLVVYFLFDLNRLKWHVRDLVNFAENMMLWLVKQYQIEAYAKKDAPGIYIGERKIGSLGFKIRKGRSYHGFSLNIDCDLTGFQSINPCGYAGLEMVRLCDLTQHNLDFQHLSQLCQDYLQQQNIYQHILVEKIPN